VTFAEKGPRDNSTFAQAPETVAPARILLVDDNLNLGNYLYQILSQFYQVEVVTGADATLAAIHDRPPDLILTDGMLLEKGGLALLRQVRLNPQNHNIPMLLLTTPAGKATTVAGLEAGADDYLVQPFSTSELLSRVAVNIELGRSRQAAYHDRVDNILDSITDAFFAVDQAWRFTYVNRQAERLLSRTASELLGQVMWEMYPGLIGSEFEQAYRRTAIERVESNVTAFYPDHERWYEVHVYPAANGITVYFRNDTDRKQFEADLQQSEERYRTLFESIDEGFCIIEVLFDAHQQPIDYRFLELNHAFADQTGLQQAVGKTARQLVPDLEEKWFEIYGHVVLTGEATRFEYSAVPMNRWFDVYACRIGSPEKSEVAIVFKDISEAKRIEAEREQILYREQATREAAERANQVKDEFLAILSHELRTPLNPILGWTRLLRGGKLDAAKTATALEAIERNAKIQVQLIEDLLDISRVLQGKLVLNLFPVDLSFAIHAALDTVRLSMDAKAIELHKHLDPTVGQVIGDVGRLQQVVWNLLSNAVKFTPSGGQITIELTQVGTNAQLQVTDTGKGIDLAFLPYVFEHFRQEDGATTRQFGGLGLGLSIVRQIVELHGGTVHVQSQGEGCGATFTVQLPLARTVAATVEEPTFTDPLSDAPLVGIQVLIVDDEADTRNLTAFVLEQAGAIVTTAPSATVALEMLAQSKLDILISDIGMPEMDGYRLMRRIRQLGNSIPAVALTAYAGEVDHQQAIAAGFHTHLTKPVEPAAIIAAIVQLCDPQ
jgi:PAS domain S-box-containing protein